MAGYFVNREATAIHDPLLARALVFENEGVRIAIITCDLTNMPAGIATVVRRLVERQAGIPASHVMVSATHAHTAPVILSGWTRYVLDGEMKRIADEYAAALPARIVKSVTEAVARLRPARVSASIGEAPALAFHRRFHMKDGSVGWNPGKLNPNIVRAAGPIDPAIPLVYVEGEDGQAIAAYVNYAIHLDTVGGTEFSSDLVYSLGEALKVARGREIVTLFSMGCAGNINHVNTAVARRQSGHGEAARIGTTLAAAVLQAIEALSPIQDVRLHAKAETLLLEAVMGTAAEAAEAHALKPQTGATQQLAKAARILEIEARANRAFEAEVQVLRIGADLVWVGLPGEIFVELGLDLKSRSRARWTVPATQANAAIGYIPHLAAYPQGSYEVVSARVKAGSGEKLVNKALELIEATTP